MIRLKFLLVILISVWISSSGYSQLAGCTDPQALNFNPEATINDGSCLYPVTGLTPLLVAGSLPQAVNETSGLIYWNGGLWTHNDSGNEPVLFKLDTISGEILQTITIAGAENIDWEDIAQDDTRIFIGDFGNNQGNRTDLKIYVTEKSSFPPSGDGSVTATSINFSYGDQQGFEKANRSNDYDCESVLAFGDSLFLFTKNWVNEQTRLYALPKNPGTYSILPADQFNVEGLITGADIFENGSEIILCGYENYRPFIWLLFDFDGTDFFGGNKRRINLSDMMGTQTEGVSYTFSRNVYISAEKTSIAPAKLFRLNTSPWTVANPATINDTEPGGHGLLLFPNPNDGNFRLNLGEFCESGTFLADVINCSGTHVVSKYPLAFSGCEAEVQLPELDHGFYLLRFYTGKSAFTSRLMVGR